jgi:hypothetical protein
MQFVQICVNGLQGSGKTEYCMYLLWLISQEYPGLVRIIYTDNLDIAFDEVRRTPPDIRVVAVCVDDAMSYQSSYRTLEANDKVQKWYMIRHIVEDRIGSTGIVYGILNWQRYSSVNANFRNPDLFAFLSPMSDPDDARKVTGKVGTRGYEAIREEYAERQTAEVRRSRTVACMPGMLAGDSVGWHNYEYVPKIDPLWTRPALLKTSEYYASAPKPTKEQTLDKLAEDPRYTRDAAIFRRVEAGETQSAIAAELHLAKSTVSEGIARIRKLLESEASQ